MRHPWAVAAVLLLATLACTAQPTARPGTGTSPEPARKGSVKASASAAVAPPADPQQRLSGLSAALFDATAARELLRAQGVARIISNHGSGLISDKSGGLVSKIRTGMVSDQGGSLISDKSGGVIGQNGAGLGEAQPATWRFALAQASAPIEPAATPEIFKEIPHLDPPFQYLSTFYKPNFRGVILGFLLADFEARGREATVVERYVWDDVPFTTLDTPSEGLFDVRASFPMRVELSRRTAFTRKIDLVIDMAIKAIDPMLLTAFKSMTVAFEMAVPGLQGGSDVLVLHAHDFTYPPGKGPGELPDGIYPTPTGFLAEGENARGKMVVKALTPPGGEVTATLTSTYTRADGPQVRTTLTTYADGRREELTADVSGGLEARLRFGVEGEGEGEVHETATGKAVGRLRWDAQGVGTISLDGAAERTLTLY